MQHESKQYLQAEGTEKRAWKLKHTNETVVKDKESQLRSPPETVLKVVNLTDLFGEDYRNESILEFEKKSELEKGDQLVYQSEVDVKKLFNVINVNATFKRLEGEK